MYSYLKTLFYLVFRQFIIRRSTGDGIYLTYDDGPHPQNTPKILESLARHGALATFFMVGKSMERHPEIVESVIRGGHTVGYHSYSHKSLKRQSLAEVRADLAKVRDLSKRFDYPIKLYRPPFGDLTITAFLWLVVNRWKIVMWSRDCRDSFDAVDEVKQNIDPQHLQAGDIILFHDDYDHAPELIESALKRYREINLKCHLL